MACLSVNPIKVNGFAYLFDCTPGVDPQTLIKAPTEN